jgi:predicted amino acid-binding ACT domain protein
VQMVSFLMTKMEGLEDLFSSEEFWKVINSDKNGFIRKSFYSLVSKSLNISSIRKHVIPELISKYILIECLKEKDASKESWECLVMTATRKFSSIRLMKTFLKAGFIPSLRNLY